ncbi:MAG: hypothetical protein H6R42_785 [Nitrospirae bacterium]|nr:hypothetical protein [Nitrospirota bacterium]
MDCLHSLRVFLQENEKLTLFVKMTTGKDGQMKHTDQYLGLWEDELELTESIKMAPLAPIHQSLPKGSIYPSPSVISK